MMSAWYIIVLLALVTLTSGSDLRESCNKCGYRSGHQEQAHSLCAGRNGYPKYFRDGHDCGKFYECNRGTAYEFLCSEGLAFNEDTKVCEPASKVRCSSGHSGPVLEPAAPQPSDNYYEFPRASGSGQNRTCNICRQAKQAIPRHANCPRTNGYYPVMFRNEKDCTQFFQCDHGTAYLIQCPAGLHFNTRINVCDYARNVNCAGPVMSPETSTAVSHGGGASPSYCHICQEAKHVIRNHPNCPTKNGYYPVFFRHQTDCSKYYQCDNGVAFEIVCPAGLHFNTAINVCDYPRNVDCTGGDASPAAPSSEAPTVDEPEQKIHPNCPIITGEQEASYWAHPRDCGKYFGCRWGCVELFSCPEGHRWDDAKKGCAAEHLVECENDGY
uniref:Chitin-binding type-2 domain-containing protein n=1 Tax=Anopheles minimus TaxID=112268 RepID=A0A182WC58_9DIPT